MKKRSKVIVTLLIVVALISSVVVLLLWPINSAHGANDPKVQFYVFPFDKNQEAKGADAYIISILDQIVGLLEKENDVSEKEKAEFRKTKEEFIRHRAEQGVWNSEILKKVNINNFFVSEIVKLELALDAANKSLEDGVSQFNAFKERIKVLEKENKEFRDLPRGFTQEEVDGIVAGKDAKIAELSAKNALLQEKELAGKYAEVKTLSKMVVRRTTPWKPKHFWIGGGMIWGTEEYPNVYGKLVDSLFEDPTYITWFGEIGARYVYKKYLAGEASAGISRDKDIFGGVCIKICYDVLNLGGGFMVLPDEKGKAILEPTINMSFETVSSRFRLGATVLPRLEKAYISLACKFGKP